MRLLDSHRTTPAQTRAPRPSLTARQLNLALWTVAAVMILGAAVVIVLGAWVPLKSAAPTDPSADSGSRTVASSAKPGLPPLESFEPIWSKPLRQPSMNAAMAAPAPPAQPAAAPVVAAAPPAITVVGTIGESLAMFRLANGNVVLKSVGEQIDGREVIAVRPGQVDVRSGDTTSTLTKPVPPATPSPDAPMAPAPEPQ